MTDRSNCPAMRHGTASDYRYGCRCPDSCEARRVYMKRWREKRLRPGMVPSIGTVRRLQALTAIGWPTVVLADRMGCSRWAVQQLRRQRSQTVLRTVAEKVTALYAELEGTPGGSALSIGWARKYQWAPPLAWDDNIDDPAAVPVEVPVGRVDRVAEALWLIRGGVPVEQAAARVGTTVGGLDRARWRRAS